MSVKRFVKNISPFNNEKEMPKGLYIVKKVLAFLLIYGVSAVVGEGIIIGAFYVMGYDPLNGVIPQGHTAELVKYYGFIVFLAISFVYCRFIEKRNIMAPDVSKLWVEYPLGGVIAVLLLLVIFAVCCVTGTFEFAGFDAGVNVGYLVAMFFGFLIQSMAEEVMCRGFLLNSLMKKTSLFVAIFVSSTAFALPHFPTLLSADFKFAVIGVINIYLVSAVFSMLYILRKNIYVVSGLHCLWNFVLYCIMGLSVSGSDRNTNAVLNFNVSSQNILNGGMYGVEASIVTTVVLGIVLAFLVKRFLNKGDKNGL